MTTTVTKPTLTYFNVFGRAEVPRLLLEDAGVDYDFVPVTNWPELKSQLTASGKLASGQTPLYEEPDGLTLVQSGAISRHLARKYGYNGGNAHEEALIDQAKEGANDAYTAVAKVIFGTPATSRLRTRPIWSRRPCRPSWLTSRGCSSGTEATGIWWARS